MANFLTNEDVRKIENIYFSQLKDLLDEDGGQIFNLADKRNQKGDAPHAKYFDIIAEKQKAPIKANFNQPQYRSVACRAYQVATLVNADILETAAEDTPSDIVRQLHRAIAGARNYISIHDGLLGVATEIGGKQAISLPKKNTTPGENEPLTLQKIDAAYQTLARKQPIISEMGYNANAYLVVTERQIRDLLNDVDASQEDKQAVHSILNGQSDTLKGFAIVPIEDNPHTKEIFLPKENSTRTCIAFSPDAFVYAIRREPNLHIRQHSGHADIWQVHVYFDEGAGRSDENMVTRIPCREN